MLLQSHGAIAKSLSRFSMCSSIFLFFEHDTSIPCKPPLFVQLLLSSLALFLGALVLGHLLGQSWAGVSLVRSHLGVEAVFNGLGGELLFLSHHVSKLSIGVAAVVVALMRCFEQRERG
jgi:hypothetical protein